MKGPLPTPVSSEHATLLARYRLHQERRNLTPGSIVTIQGKLRSLARAMEAEDTALLEATREQVELFLDRRRTRAGHKLNARTRYYWIAHFHTFFTWAMSEDLAESDPTALIIRPKMRSTLPRPIDTAELSDAIRGAGPQVRAMLLLAAFAGLRCQEIAGLERDDVIEAKDLLRVRHGKGQKERVVPLHPDVMVALRMLPMPQTGPLFLRPSGSAHTPVTVSEALRDYLRKVCGIDATAHQLRHWFATEIYATSKDIRVTQELLGHSNPATTARYVAFSRVDAAAAVSSLAL